MSRFWLQSRPPAWVDVVTEEEAEYPLSAGGMAVRALLQGRGGRIPWWCLGTRTTTAPRC
ncbi:hypothetical protein HML84_01090 [Alcanivorax sp. IO_7]|nr:hypothetical protein HML84_01090 [Alcanivorax sp. IO_7]